MLFGREELLSDLEEKLEPGDLRPMFEAIVNHIPAPKGDPEALPQILVTQLDYDNHGVFVNVIGKY